MNKLIIHHFESFYAICEKADKTMIHIPKYKLPLGCKKGDYLFLDSVGMYQKDPLAKMAAKNKKIY